MLGLFAVTTAILLILVALLDDAIWRFGRSVNLDEPVIFIFTGLGNNGQIGLEPPRFT